MKTRTLISCVLCILLMMLTDVFSISVNAYEQEGRVQPVDEVIKSAGLINGFSLSITSGTKKIYVTAATHASYTMAKVGFTNISIQCRRPRRVRLRRPCTGLLRTAPGR